MKKIIPLTLVVIIGCIIVILMSVYFIQTIKTPGKANSSSPTIAPSITTIIPGTWQTIAPAGSSTSVTDIKGPLFVSIGEYNAKLAVLIDDTAVGEVSRGEPLNTSVTEGYHTVRVCEGDVCEQMGIEIKSGIKNMVDFGERLIKNNPLGSLNVSVGDYDAKLPVYLDNVSVGDVSRGKPLNLAVREGIYTVRVCSGSVCEQQGVLINSTSPISVDFGERFKEALPKGPLTVSIGGYNAELPVYIDDDSVGTVSMGNPLNLMVSEGRHILKVCAGVVCENETVDIQFAQPLVVDFGERLKKDVEFPVPTARIVNSVLTGDSMTVNVEFINLDTTDHTISATIGCGYSYVDSTSNERHNNYGQSVITESLKSGTRVNSDVTISLPGGSRVIASAPTVVNVEVT